MKHVLLSIAVAATAFELTPRSAGDPANIYDQKVLVANRPGLLSGGLLVGSVGDRTIAALDPATGRFRDYACDGSGKPISIDGLRASRSGTASAWAMPTDRTREIQPKGFVLGGSREPRPMQIDSLDLAGNDAAKLELAAS